MLPYIPSNKRRQERGEQGGGLSESTTTVAAAAGSGDDSSSLAASRKSAIKLQELLKGKGGGGGDPAPFSKGGRRHQNHAASARSAPRAPSGPSPRASEARADSAPGQHRRRSKTREASTHTASPSPRRIAHGHLESSTHNSEDDEDGSTFKRSSKYRAVAFVEGTDFSVACPECGAIYSAHDDIVFRGHVFECRERNGVDPLMPLHLVLKSSTGSGGGGGSTQASSSTPRASTASANMGSGSGVSRVICSSLVHVDLFEGVPLTPRRATTSGSSSPPTQKTLLLSNQHGVNPARSMPYATPAPPTTSRKSAANSPSRPRQMSTATTSQSRTARKGISRPPAIAFAPGSLDAEVETALMAALYENDDGEDCVLDLTGRTISHRQASRIESILAPNDGSEQLPVKAVILVGTKVIGEDSAQRLFTGIVKNKYIETLELGDNEEGSTSPPKSTATSSPRTPLDRLLSKTRYTSTGMMKVLANNVQRRKDREANGEFLGDVDAYLERGRAFNEGAYALIKRVNVTTAQLQRAELKEREKLAEWIAKAKARDALRTRRLEHAHMQFLEREAFFLAEDRRRAKLIEAQVQGISILCESEESCLRSTTVARQEWLGRARLKLEERENIWRCLVVRDHRKGFHTIQRLFVEGEAELDIEALSRESVFSLEGLKLQQGQHLKVSLWRRRLREEAENFVRYEAKLREGVGRDEETHWASSKEKFFKTIEATSLKVASQKQYVEDSERIRRKEIDVLVNSYLDLEFHFFRAETRLLAQKQKTIVREQKRRDLLARVPTLTLTPSPSQPEVLVVATQTPKHAPPEPSRIFAPNLSVSCGMPHGWSDDLAHAEQLCKTSVNEEKSSITDYIQLIKRSLLIKNEAFSCACDPVSPDPSMEVLMAITRPTPVFSTAWKTREDSNASSPLRPSLTMLRGVSSRRGSRATFNDDDGDDDDVVAAEVERVLQHRGAWYDKVPVSVIRSAKEQLYGVRLSIQFSQPRGGSSSDSAVTHQLLSCISHSLQIEQAQRRADIHRRTQDRVRRERKSRSNVLISSTSLDDLESMESGAEGPPTYADPIVYISIDGEELPPLTMSDPVEEWISVARSRTNSLMPGGNALEVSGRRASVLSDGTLEDSMMMAPEEDDDDDQALFDVPPLIAEDLPSALSSVVIRIQCASSFCSLDDGATGHSSSQRSARGGDPPSVILPGWSAYTHQFHFLDPALLASMLESVMYRVDIEEENAGRHGAGLHKMEYTLEVDLHQSDCYHKHHPDVGQLLPPTTSNNAGSGGGAHPAAASSGRAVVSQVIQPPFSTSELYAPRQPDDNVQLVTVSTTGSCYVGVVPSCISVDEDVITNRCVVIEGQMDGIPIVRGITSVEDKYVVLRDPSSEGYAIKEKLHCDIDELKSLRVCGGLPGGYITLEVVGEGASNGDRLSLEDELPTAVRFDAAQDRTRAIRTIYINDFPFAAVIDGTLQMTGSVTPSVKRPRHGSRAELRIDKDYALSYTSASISTLLSKLRYHNYDNGPDEGTRELRIAVRSSTGAESEVRIPFMVESIDKPTELRLPFKKLTYRSPTFSIPAKLQPNCTEVLVPVCLQAQVVDEDTDRFSGGSAKFVLVGGCKGDSLAFCPDTRLHNFIDEATDVAPLLSMGGEDGRDVMMEGRVVATLEQGPVLLLRDNLGEEEHTEIRLTLAQEDNCSIAAVQAICRSVVLVNNNPAFQFKTHPQGQRDVRIELQIMDNEQACHIIDNVSIRGGAHTVHLLERGTSIDFKEGNQPCKLGYFDLNSDKISPINNFGGGWILATVPFGGDNDNIGLKQEDSEYKVIEPRIKKGGDGIAQLASTMMGSSSGGGSAALSRLRSAALMSSKMAGSQSLSSTAPSAFSKSMALNASTLLSPAEGKFPGVYNGFARPALVHFTGMTAPMAAVMSVPNGLLIQLFPDTKRDVVTRKHALGLLRNITYHNDCQQPQFVQKVARVLVCDNPSSTPSQCLVQISLEVTDDITEIRVKSPKKRMVQSIQNNFPLFPRGRAVVYDSDTDFFDGASFTVQCVAGSTRGDAFTFVPPYDQHGFVQRTNVSIPEYTGVEIPDLTFSEDQKLVLINGIPVAKIEFAYRENGMCEVKVVFECPNAGGVTAKGGKTSNITKDVFTYIINSICFGNQADRLRDNTRVMVARVKDPGNPVEGKMRMTVDVCPPHIVLSPASSTFESLLQAKLPISPEVGSGVNPGSRIVVNLDKIHDLKSACGVPPYCRISVACGSQEQLARVRLFLPLEEHGLKLYAGGNVAMSNGSPAFRLDTADQHSVLISFIPNTKPTVMSKEKLQGILRSVVVSVTEELTLKSNGGGASGELMAQAPTTVYTPNMMGGGISPPQYDSDPSIPVVIPTVTRSPSKSTLAESRRGSDQSGTGGGVSAVGNPRKPTLPRKTSLNRIRGGRKGSVVAFAAQPAVSPGTAASSSLDSEDHDDVTLVVTWSLHDGENESRIVTRLVPKGIPTLPPSSTAPTSSHHHRTEEEVESEEEEEE